MVQERRAFPAAAFRIETKEAGVQVNTCTRRGVDSRFRSNEGSFSHAQLVGAALSGSGIDNAAALPGLRNRRV